MARRVLRIVMRKRSFCSGEKFRRDTIRIVTDVVDLGVVEAAVRAAIRTGNENALHLLGHGEISIVLGWPAKSPTMALKRVPPFRSREAADSYEAACVAMFEILEANGVSVLPTTLHRTERNDGRVVVYHRQPAADTSQLGTNILRAAPDGDASALALLDAIVRAAVAVCRKGSVGFDVQAANWLWDGATATQLDFTSPFIVDNTGRDLRFDTSSFLREYPAPMRGLLKKELLKIVHRFTTAEGALTDMVANLQKEYLHRWVGPAIEIAASHGVHIDRAETETMLAEDAKLMPVLLKVRKAYRWWVHHTGRHYDALLPHRTTYELLAEKYAGHA